MQSISSLPPKQSFAFRGSVRPPAFQFGNPQPIQDVTEFYQGRLPDCQFLAAMLMALHFDPQALDKMIQPRPDGGFRVTFPGARHLPIDVTRDEVAQQPCTEDFRPNQVVGPEKIRIVEAAYIRLLAMRNPEQFTEKSGLAIRDMFFQQDFDPERFTAAYAYRMLTGESPIVRTKPDPDGGIRQGILQKRSHSILGITSNDLKFNDYRYHASPRYEADVREALSLHAKAPERYAISLVTHPAGKVLKRSMDLGEMLPAYHVLVVDEVDLEKQRVILKDPQNTRFGLVLPMADIPEHFSKIYVAQRPAAQRENPFTQK